MLRLIPVDYTIVPLPFTVRLLTTSMLLIWQADRVHVYTYSMTCRRRLYIHKYFNPFIPRLEYPSIDIWIYDTFGNDMIINPLMLTVAKNSLRILMKSCR